MDVEPVLAPQPALERRELGPVHPQAVDEDDAVGSHDAGLYRLWAVALWDVGCRPWVGTGLPFWPTAYSLQPIAYSLQSTAYRQAPTAYSFTGSRTRMCSSRSCCSDTSVGASVSGQVAVCVFGKAITSRMRVGARHQHREAVEAERDAAVRGRAELERLEQEAELLLRFLGTDAEQLEHRGLHVAAMDTHRAAADLGAVQHHVVGARQRAARVGLERRRVVVRRRR